ncbi:MAG: hypothetical protein WCL29_00025 [Pseudomonadota bacterium]
MPQKPFLKGPVQGGETGKRKRFNMVDKGGMKKFNLFSSYFAAF